MQKRQTHEKGFALLKNDITTFELASRLQISSKHNFSGDFLGGVTKSGYVFKRFRFEIKNSCQDD